MKKKFRPFWLTFLINYYVSKSRNLLFLSTRVTVGRFTWRIHGYKIKTDFIELKNNVNKYKKHKKQDFCTHKYLWQSIKGNKYKILFKNRCIRAISHEENQMCNSTLTYLNQEHSLIKKWHLPFEVF